MSRNLSVSQQYSYRYSQFLQRLRQARLEAQLSQQQVADLLDKSQSYVSRSENGERRVDVVELQEFATIYNKPLSYFLPLKEDES